jgi:Tfp pilus assembly protein PilF
MRYIGTIGAALSLAVVAGCQQTGKGDAAGGAVSESPANRPAKLVEGLGPVHHAVSTANPAAQKFFNQGMAYLYGFNHAEAERSFAKAAELDPKLAMAQWGRAIVLGPNINLPEIEEKAARDAYAAVQKALALSAHATAKEKAYINALAKRYPADPKADWRKPAYDYKVAMGEVAKKYPEDLDAATLYAESAMNLRPWKLYTPDGKPEEGTEEIVATLEWVMQRNPNHIGALHYYIHAVEASTTPQRAIPAAERLPKLAPQSGHLVHMPAHIWIRVGDYDRAIKANADAALVDERYISCCAPKGGGLYPAMYYTHNLHFLAVAAAMAGRSAEAEEASRKMAKHLEPVVAEAPTFEAYAAVPVLLAARQAKWGDIAKWPEPKAKDHATRAAWHFARGLAAASLKDVGTALTEQEKFAAEAARAKDLPLGNNTGATVFKIAEHLLNGKILAARGDAAGATRQLELAVKVGDTLSYDEPPAFPWPPREALGAHLLRTGDALGAEKVFREDLVRSPNNPRSLFGLAESLKARGKHYDADEVREQLDQRWAAADVKLRIEDF